MNKRIEYIARSFALESVKPGWKEHIFDELKESYFLDMLTYLDGQYMKNTVYPPKEKVFEIFRRIDIDDAKVIILGQDPYHGEGQANGMCFSVSSEVKNPPSLVNIFKELENEYGESRTLGDLSDWVEQGVLLLNSILTVEKSKPGSHRNMGWEKFTDKIIGILNMREEPLVFVLWGNYAIDKAAIVDQNRHCVLKSSHPSPFSCYRGYFGNNHFRMINDYLIENGKSEIKWV